jgi:hypothetical protein
MDSPHRHQLDASINHVCSTPIVGGRWFKGTKYPCDLHVVNNPYPDIPTQGSLEPIKY